MRMREYTSYATWTTEPNRTAKPFQQSRSDQQRAGWLLEFESDLRPYIPDIHFCHFCLGSFLFLLLLTPVTSHAAARDGFISP